MGRTTTTQLHCLSWSASAQSFGPHSMVAEAGEGLTRGSLAAPASPGSPVWAPAVRLCNTAKGPSKLRGVAPTSPPRAVSNPPLASVDFTMAAVAARAK